MIAGSMHEMAPHTCYILEVVIKFWLRQMVLRVRFVRLLLSPSRWHQSRSTVLLNVSMRNAWRGSRCTTRVITRS